MESVVCCWLLVVGYLLLVICCWLFVVGYLLLIIGHMMSSKSPIIKSLPLSPSPSLFFRAIQPDMISLVIG
ncbi:MAG TPA: hypothetical protein DD379_00790 [Cyanobacteria bacterium UBA11162]|nr:hypothetical protein [Cyanobacteria bacterium UBA11162]